MAHPSGSFHTPDPSTMADGCPGMLSGTNGCPDSGQRAVERGLVGAVTSYDGELSLIPDKGPDWTVTM
jgi:hypothetical protein